MIDKNECDTPISGMVSNCWKWKGWKDKHGYGMMTQWKGEKQLHAFGHRVSWIIHKGEIPFGMGVCHHCDNTECCNPEHLFLGNQKANMEDAAKKKRTTHGVKHAQSKLSEVDVKMIRLLYKSHSKTQAQLMRIFQISPAQIHAVVHRKSYKHVL